MNRVPKLRFKEFNGDWEKLNAEEIFKNISNKNHNGDLPILAVTQDKGVVYRDSLDLKINSSETGIKNYKIIEPGDFVISLRSFQGGIEYSSILGISSPAYTVLKPKIEISDFFYKVYLKKESFISELNSTIEGIRDGKQISYAMFSKLKLPYTKVEEQQKIADFLSSVDKKISIAKEKLDLFKDYKKGIMQKIFNQELRFKDSNGNNYPEWEEKRLGDVFSFKQGYQIPFKEQIKTKEKGYVRYLYISDFFSDKNLLYVKDDGKEKITETDITVANTGNTAGSFYRGKSGILSNNMFNIQNDEKVVTNDFLFQFLGTSLYSNQLKTFFNSSGQPHLGHKNMSMIIINYPVSFEEQQKIVDFLSSIDNKIDNLTSELEDLKEFKKGLLQQIFV